VNWSKSRGVELNTLEPLESDVLVLSNAANFLKWIKIARQPVILDIVDGYLGENPNLFRDFARNVIRSINGTSSLRWITYTRHLREACRLSDAVIVGSEEQRKSVIQWNNKVFVITDDHSELDRLFPDYLKKSENIQVNQSKRFIFWEGFGYTLKHFKFMSGTLDLFMRESNYGMYLVTPAVFPRWGGYLGKVHTSRLVKRMFPHSWSDIIIVPWSSSNIIEYANKSEFGIIPIDPKDNFGRLKPENKLLSMWRLGLPVLFSPIPSYIRISKTAKIENLLKSDLEWDSALRKISKQKHLRDEMRSSSLIYIAKEQTQNSKILLWDNLFEEILKKLK